MALKMESSNELKEWMKRGKLDVAVVVQPKEHTRPDAQFPMSITPVRVEHLNTDVALENLLPLAV